MLRRILFLALTAVFVLGSLPLGARAEDQPREITPGAIKVPDGYHVEAYASNLTVPTTAAFDGDDLLVAESGFTEAGDPRVLRIKPDGTVTVVASQGLVAPVTGVLVIDKKIYISHKGKVSIVENGGLRDIVTGLPSNGDHQNNKIVLGPDGKIYMGQGTVTNSGVVGEDNYVFGWLSKAPDTHDVPCERIDLAGQVFTTDDPLTPEDDEAKTRAYGAFGKADAPGQMIEGETKCNGSILRFDPDGSHLEVVAWGFRNPFGVQFDADGQLWTTFHGADVRGSRPIWNDADYLVKVQEGGWYGWPEYFRGKPATDASLDAPGEPKAKMLWKSHPPLAPSFLTFESHAGTNGLAFSPSGAFGYEGDAFIAMFGTFAPITSGLDLQPAGFRVARVDMKNKTVSDFAKNTLPGPSYLNRSGGLDRPSDVLFGPDGGMYVVDWGGSTLTDEGLKEVPRTGVVWRIFKDGQSALRSGGPIVVPANAKQENDIKPIVPANSEAAKQIWPLLAVGTVIVLLIVGGIVWAVRRKRMS